MSENEWCIIGEFPSCAQAEVIRLLLEEENVPAKIEPSDPIMALNSGVRLLVECDLAHRAKWVLKKADFTADELNFLATGELPQKRNDNENLKS